jgi:hypothetical protein
LTLFSDDGCLTCRCHTPSTVAETTTARATTTITTTTTIRTTTKRCPDAPCDCERDQINVLEEDGKLWACSVCFNEAESQSSWAFAEDGCMRCRCHGPATTTATTRRTKTTTKRCPKAKCKCKDDEVNVLEEGGK